MIGLFFERSVTARARVRRWQMDGAPPRYPANAHDAVELCWVERGRCSYRIGRRTFEVSAGGAIVVPCGVEHLTEIAAGTTAGSMWLSPELFDEERPLEPGAFDRPDLIGPGRALLRLAEAGFDPMLAECALEGLALRIASAKLRSSRTRDPRIRRAIEQIEARHAESIDVEELARAARMSRYHFSRVFREETGTSPYRYLIKTRLAHAARLLAAGSCNVTEAALAAGFTDLGRFGRAFKAEHGRTPSAFSLEHRSHKARHEAHGAGGTPDRLMAECEASSSSP